MNTIFFLLPSFLFFLPPFTVSFDKVPAAPTPEAHIHRELGKLHSIGRLPDQELHPNPEAAVFHYRQAADRGLVIAVSSIC